MKLKINRLFPKATYIIGDFFTNGNFFADSLERPWLNNHPDTSCIPTGVYAVKMQFSPHFQRPMPHILNVPGRDKIMIHDGSVIANLEGCISIGKNSAVGVLTETRVSSDKLNALLSALPQDEDITIEIV